MKPIYRERESTGTVVHIVVLVRYVRVRGYRVLRYQVMVPLSAAPNDDTNSKRKTLTTSYKLIKQRFHATFHKQTINSKWVYRCGIFSR